MRIVQQDYRHFNIHGLDVSEIEKFEKAYDEGIEFLFTIRGVEELFCVTQVVKYSDGVNSFVTIKQMSGLR